MQAAHTDGGVDGYCAIAESVVAVLLAMTRFRAVRPSVFGDQGAFIALKIAHSSGATSHIR